MRVTTTVNKKDTTSIKVYDPSEIYDMIALEDNLKEEKSCGIIEDYNLEVIPIKDTVTVKELIDEGITLCDLAKLIKAINK
jgi:hypothetical protein